MYLLPLNSDELFKRVFGDLIIAKAFIEDMLGVKITEIVKMDTDHRITNKSAFVRFDYRCKIDGKYVIIEMQQSYKQNVVRRFFLYHCLNTSLQLETIPETIRTDKKGKEHRTRHYEELQATITIVWLVQDNFDLSVDYIEYNHYPKVWIDFLQNDLLWKKSKAFLNKRRIELLEILKNDRRNLDFLSENRLFFVFQPNIIKNKQAQEYVKWFEFAEKTRNPDNKEADFKEYSDNLIFSNIMDRLTVSHSDNQDLIKEMGLERYQAAKKLGQELDEQDRQFFLYWKVYDDIAAKTKLEFAGDMKAVQDQLSEAIELVEEAEIKAEMAEVKAEIAEKRLHAMERVVEKEKQEAQKRMEKVEKEKQETQKRMEKVEKEKQEAQKRMEKVEKEKQEAKKTFDKAVEKERQAAQKKVEKAIEKERQEEQKKAKILEKQQKKLLEQEKQRAQLLLEQKQIQLMNNLFAAGLSMDIIAKSLEVSVQQIITWQKLKK